MGEIVEVEHLWVPMPDGCRLAARLWRPADAETTPVPTILEYIPYRKNDLTAERDTGMHPVLAANGYAVLRLDLRGAGDSEGVMRDEYLPQELQDGVDAIAWIAAQPWSDGSVGMIGISWGGFNGLQIAALQPPALKAVITVCSTDDRYADDVHYMGGCLLLENLSWASIMFARNSLPPDPRHHGDAWRDVWRQRLTGSGLWIKNWLEHQTRDAFWRHGSICEDFSRVRVPVYAVSGWADGYCRSVLRLMEHLSGPRKGLIGPWVHKYPHLATPGPAIDFIGEQIRWWDQWLKGRDTGIMAEPMLRLYLQDSAPPRGSYDHRPGRWIAEPSWPSPQVTPTPYRCSADGRLLSPEAGPATPGTAAIASPLDTGLEAGKWCAYGLPGDQPVDQRATDALSLCFETAPLETAVEIAGDAVLHLRVAADRPVAQIAARLVDVAPDGAATRVTYGVLNLTHRDGHAAPQPLEPGQPYTVAVPFKSVAQRFAPGHRIRLALTSTYYPFLWPAPEPVTLTVHLADTVLDLPVRGASDLDAALAPFGAPTMAPPLRIDAEVPELERTRVLRDLGTGAAVLEVLDDGGRRRFVDIDLTITELGRERYTTDGSGDPTAVSAATEWSFTLARGDWSVHTETATVLTATAEAFLVHANLRAWEGETLVHEQEWEERIPRVLV